MTQHAHAKRSEPHPVSRAVYEEQGDGLVRVTDKARGKGGLFDWDGQRVEGELTQADLHFLRYIGGPTLPPEKDIFWTLLPVAGLGEGIQFNLSPGRGGAMAGRAQPAASEDRLTVCRGCRTPDRGRPARILLLDRSIKPGDVIAVGHTFGWVNKIGVRAVSVLTRDGKEHLWWNRFGPMFAGEVRRKRVSSMRGFRHWRWHLEEL